MALSQQILHLLDSLAERGLTVDFAIFAVEELPDGLTEAERAEFRQDEQSGRALAKWIAEAKLRPIWTSSEHEVFSVFGSVVGDSGLDEHFAIAALADVPRIVRRWNRLQTTHVILLPGEKVARYMRQQPSATCTDSSRLQR